MQKVSWELYEHLSQTTDVRLAKWSGSNRWLPLVLPYLALKAFWILIYCRPSVIYLQDGLLAPLGCCFKLLGKPVVVTIHGLDITYSNWVYQQIIPRCVKRLDRVVCVSHATKEECLARGIAEEKTAVIGNVISDDFYMGLNSSERHELRKGLSSQLGFDLGDGRVILSVGRLVERKGIHWFVDRVMPHITERYRDCKYLIVGDGIYRRRICEAVERRGLEDNVVMLGHVPEGTLRQLYNAADDWGCSQGRRERIAARSQRQ
jgi:glycosyltransferase involved in cell wall biosynthesis